MKIWNTCEGHTTHAIMAVGYGTDSYYGDYFLVKNSWGADWGLDEYIKIGAGSENIVCVMLKPSTHMSESKI